jgi:hypothetical protein
LPFDGLHRAIVAFLELRHRSGADVVALNRAHPKSTMLFVFDFINDSETMRAVFAAHYRTTILSNKADPSKLHDIAAALYGRLVYDQAQGTDTALFLHVARPD